MRGNIQYVFWKYLSTCVQGPHALSHCHHNPLRWDELECSHLRTQSGRSAGRLNTADKDRNTVSKAKGMTCISRHRCSSSSTVDYTFWLKPWNKHKTLLGEVKRPATFVIYWNIKMFNWKSAVGKVTLPAPDKQTDLTSIKLQGTEKCIAGIVFHVELINLTAVFFFNMTSKCSNTETAIHKYVWLFKVP